MPPVRRAVLMGTRGWFQRSGSSSFEFLLAEGDSLERSDRNVLQDTFCFQLSTAFQFYCYSAVHISETPLRKLTCLMFAASFLLPMLVKGGKVIYQCKGYLFSISSGIHF